MSLAKTIREDLSVLGALCSSDKKEAACYLLFLPLLLPLFPLLVPSAALMYYLIFQDDDRHY